MENMGKYGFLPWKNGKISFFALGNIGKYGFLPWKIGKYHFLPWKTWEKIHGFNDVWCFYSNNERVEDKQ